MKLLRFGPAGQERPGLLDAEGNIRDLSGHLEDIDGAGISPAGLARLAALRTETLPRVFTQKPKSLTINDIFEARDRL